MSDPASDQPDPTSELPKVQPKKETVRIPLPLLSPNLQGKPVPAQPGAAPAAPAGAAPGVRPPTAADATQKIVLKPGAPASPVSAAAAQGVRPPTSGGSKQPARPPGAPETPAPAAATPKKLSFSRKLKEAAKGNPLEFGLVAVAALVLGGVCWSLYSLLQIK